MKIICDTTFLDGRDRFEAGEKRVVDDERGRHFIAQKWAHEEGTPPVEPGDGPPTTLTVDNSAHGQEARHG